jgi:MFS family permease
VLPLVIAALVPTGIGIAFLLSPMTTAALGSVPAEQRGQAAGLVSAGRQLGSVVGVGAMTVLVGRSGERIGTALALTLAAVLMFGASAAAGHVRPKDHAA